MNEEIKYKNLKRNVEYIKNDTEKIINSFEELLISLKKTLLIDKRIIEEEQLSNNYKNIIEVKNNIEDLLIDINNKL